MTEYLKKIMEEIGFSDDACKYFLNMYSQLGGDGVTMLEELRHKYFLDGGEDENEANGEVYHSLDFYANENGISSYGLQMLFMLCCSKRLEVGYKKKKLGRELFIDLMKDLEYKNEECKKVYGEWGMAVFGWMHWHFLMKRFALGRFQYEKHGIDVPYNKSGFSLSVGDEVLKMHIPSSGPLSREKRIDSYKRAHKFYGYKPGEKMVIICNSWLLFNENINIFDEKSNLRDFMNDFDNVQNTVCENAFPDSWRVFYRDYEGSTDGFPMDTSLQRNIAKYLAEGKKIGFGYGVLIFDGENIVNKI